MTDLPPWRREADLRALLSHWRCEWAGRTVARVAVGAGWVRLYLTAPARPAARLFLCARPGAALLCDEAGPLPAALREALGPTRRAPLGPRLVGSRWLAARLLPDDLAVSFEFAPSDASPPWRLVQQLFGSRGNVILVEPGDRLAWALHPGPPLALVAPPPAELAAAGGDGAAAPPADGARVAEAFREAARARLLAQLDAELVTRCARALRQSAEGTARLLANLERDLSGAARGDELRRAAEAMAAALHAVPRGASRVELPDPAGGPPLSVELDPARSAAANMEEYFRLARKAERGHALIETRLAAARRRAEALAAARDALAAAEAGAADRLAAHIAWWREHAALLGRVASGPAGAPRPAAPPTRPFRRYLIDSRWEVWIGRDNAENDRLTHGAAAPHDIWLHAQGVPGSHAVLRTGGHPEAVPRQVLEKAAALAALHSRARHSSLVPVVHTLRKYVRKPRRSPAGTAVCEREKTLFAAPGVPAGVTPA